MHVLRSYTRLVFLLIICTGLYILLYALVTRNKGGDAVLELTWGGKREEDFFSAKNPRIQYAEENRAYLISAQTDKTHWANLHLLNLTLPRRVANIRSGCWWSRPEEANTCPRFTLARRVVVEEEISPTSPVLRCLSYFYLIGQAKCGTTDIFHKIALHPEVAMPDSKEPFWFFPVRFQKECSSINSYLDQYHSVAHRIQMELAYSNKSLLVTGDGSTTAMSGMTYWELLPGNEGCKAPCITNAHLIHHINPQAKILVSLRNPTDRCYSYYLMKADMLMYNASQSHFDSLVRNEIAEFNACRRTHSLRQCVYNTSQENYLTTAISLRSSIYHVHLMDWLGVFPRTQTHVVHFENYTKHTDTTLSGIYNFLGLGRLSEEQLLSIASQTSSRNERKRQWRRIGDMWPSTRDMLQKFFHPHNEILAHILKDKIFLWDR